MAAETSFGFGVVYDDIHSRTRATLHIERADEVADAAVLQRNLVNVVITYDNERRRVTVMTSLTEANQGFVRSACVGLPPEISTGFSADNEGVLASLVNAATEVLVFSGPSPPPPISVEALFRPSSDHHNIVKIIISDTEIFTPLRETRIVSKTELTLHASERLAPGTLFGFLIQKPNLAENLPQLTLSATDGKRFIIPRILALKLLRMHNKDTNSHTLLVPKIPKPLLWLLRFQFEKSLSYKVGMVRDLLVESSAFILSILEWLPYLWVEEIAVCGCKILGSRINFDVGLGRGLQGIAQSLCMEQS